MKYLGNVDIGELSESQKYLVYLFHKIDDKRKWDKTSLQKIVFLLTKEFPDKLDRYNRDYVAYDFGPYSEEVEEDVAWLQTLGIITDRLTVTVDSQNLVDQIEKEKADFALNIEPFLEGFIDLSREDLLYVVYNLYPSFTTGSKILHRVSKVKGFESIHFQLSHVQEGQSLELTTDRGNVVMVSKEKGKLTITVGRGYR